MAAFFSEDTTIKVSFECGQVSVDGSESAGSESVYITLDVISLSGARTQIVNPSAFPIRLD